MLPGFVGDKLQNVLVVFVARNPESGGQFIVGWYKNATVYRYEQNSNLKARHQLGYFLEAPVGNGVLLPKRRRSFIVPRGKGGFGQANICYVFHGNGSPKSDAPWIADALEFIKFYKHENVATNPESATDQDIADAVEASIEGGAGYQSDPRIRMAIEDYAMKWAEEHLRKEGLQPVDKHKTESFDFLCSFGGKDLFVEVKGTQSDGTCISLTPNEVAHAKKHSNSALFIVYEVRVKDRKRPIVTGGKELFLMPWDITVGKLEPRGYAFTVPTSAFSKQ